MDDIIQTAEPLTVRDRTPASIKTDNLIRQRLRIGDPRDPREVAEGLKRLFPKDAGLLACEAQGFAALPARPSMAERAPESAATSAELKQGIADIERDRIARLHHGLDLLERVAERAGQPFDRPRPLRPSKTPSSSSRSPRPATASARSI